MTTTKRQPKLPATATGRVAGSGQAFTGPGIVRLSDPEMKPAMDRLKARIAADPEFAKSLLQSAGIVTAKGKLAKRYGG